MIIRRRTRSLIIVTIIVLFVLVINKWSKQTCYVSKRASTGTFAWRDVAKRYPVTCLKGLPEGKSRRLPKIQHDFPIESVSDRNTRLERLNAVKQSFLRCWNSYRERAWMQDELAPMSGESRNRFSGWATTLVDSLDMLWMLGLRRELSEAIKAAATINFTTSTEQHIDIFETTIRYLGGLLSAYDLTHDSILLSKAIEVGEMLLVAFDTPNHMPVTRWDWQKAADGHDQVAPESAFAAELGSLTLDFTRLSQITKDPIWYDNIARITELFASQQSSTHVPGLWPINVNAQDMVLNKDVFFSLGGMSDSLYEYFPKTYALLGGLEPIYRNLYKKAMDAGIKHIFFRPMTPQNHDILIPGNAYASSRRDINLDAEAQHLGCFAGGTLALGSKLFNIPSHLKIAQKLVHGCIWAYNTSAHGIMPESFHLVPCESTNKCAWDESEWHTALEARHYIDVSAGKSLETIIRESRLSPGFVTISDPRYLLRPEAIESLFVLYRITGDRTLQDEAWKMFTAIQSLTETEFGNAELDDVTHQHMPPRKNDRMESYWMAETLKYFYLIFSDFDLLSLDDYVFNTEGHPFMRPGTEFVNHQF